MQGGDAVRDPNDATWVTIFGMTAAMIVFIGVLAYLVHAH